MYEYSLLYNQDVMRLLLAQDDVYIFYEEIIILDIKYRICTETSYLLIVIVLLQCTCGL